MKTVISIDNQDCKTIIKITSERSLGNDDIKEIKECFCNVFRCNQSEININIIEL